ncbi:MAG: hypothetical protein MHM6MM_007530 [Cercozoa sp. M6MM]
MNPVFFYVPNIIGYGRVVTALLALLLCESRPFVAAASYALSMGLDAVDGVAARHFNQCSKFGAMLDMLTDRMSTCGLLIVLARLYPDYWQVFALLIVLDTVSHWMQMDSRLMSGAKSHKGARNALLNFYYTFPFALLFFCVGAEAFLIALFVKAHTNDQEAGTLFAQINTFMTYTAYVCMPVFGMKQLFNVVQTTIRQGACDICGWPLLVDSAPGGC